MKSILRLTVNGRPREDAVAENALLIDYLRDSLGLTGTKQGCDGGECGACTVLVDGRPRLACSTLAHSVVGREVETIEGLSHAGNLSRLQRAFHEHLGSQCGFCTPGMIMAAEALLRSNPRPDRDQIKAALSGNLCRCTGYVKIIESVEAAARPVEQTTCAPTGRPEGREPPPGAAPRRTAVTPSHGEGAGGRAAP